MGSIPGGEGDQGHGLVDSPKGDDVFSRLQEFFHSSPAAVSSFELSGVDRVAAAYVLGRLVPEAPSRPLLLICEGHRQAQLALQDLAFFLSGVSAVRLAYYPALDVSPYVPASPTIAVTAERLETLYWVASAAERPLEHLIVVAPVRALFERCVDSAALLKGCLRIGVGDELDRELLIGHLQEVGYLRGNLVEDRGTFAVRGAIVDLFPPVLKNPIRLEFFGDEVESIRFFNPESQRALPSREGLEKNEVLILPVREITLDDSTVPQAQTEIKRWMDDAEIAKSERERICELVGNRIYFPGIEHYLPFFRKNLVSPLAYFSKVQAFQAVLHSKGVVDATNAFQAELDRAYEEARGERHPTSVVKPEMRFAAETQMHNLSTLRLERLEITKAQGGPAMRLLCKNHESLRKEMEKARSGVGEPLKPLLDLLADYRSRGYRVFVVCSRKTQVRRLTEMLHLHSIDVEVFEEDNANLRSLLHPAKESQDSGAGKRVGVMIGSLDSGFVLPGQALAIITDEEIFGPRIERRMRQDGGKRLPGQQTSVISAFSELAAGDYVVHLDFGIARYLGLEHMKIAGAENDFLLLEFRDEAKLYLPVHRISRVQKYVGGEAEDISLDRLGNTASWEKAQQKVRGQIKEVAKELVQLYASRQVAKGHAFQPPDDLYHEFEGEFPFEETPDQERSIQEVVEDMLSERPMDRLICGDVGFGKTEVAIRGIFLAAMDGYQSALLAPTTVLVHQHLKTLEKRFAGYPIRLGMLSRFATKTEVQQTIEGLAKGTVDVVVGTHRLLSADVAFKKLGLLVVDEEQRFGVKHKERIKLLKKNIDVLTLSATPIPRTLNMSMIGIRDLSVINTPPMDRVSIRTMICEFDDRVIREAVLQEVRRGGQVYFVHNIVQSIEQMADYLKKIVPEARLAIAHGQMNEENLERVMVEFVERKSDVLLCTSIIESGLDIPSVNTIIVNRADRFGLSQLYQIRGRVGRSSQRAYAYLLIPGQTLISEQAQKRLEVLQRYTELGSGFKIASYDLEIRGAGNLLGKDQAGHIKAVGLELYATLMSKALRELKGERVEEEVDPEIDLRIPAFIPQEYIPEDDLRLGTYKRLSMLETDEEVEEMEIELKDRFGSVPREVKNLLHVIEIKILAKKSAISKLVFSGSSTTVTFDPRTSVDIKHLLYLVNTHKGWQLFPDNRLVVTVPPEKSGIIPIDREERVLKAVMALVKKLLGPQG